MTKRSSSLLKKLVISAVLFCPVLSFGQTILELRDSYYIAANADVAWHNDIKFEFDDNAFSKFSYDVGQGISFSIGKICRNWRLEIEGAYRKSNLNRFISDIDGSLDATGFVRDFSLMLNGYWDTYIPCSWWIFYIGGGFGVTFAERRSCAGAVVDCTGIEAQCDGPSTASNTLFAWQGMSGFAYEIVERVFLNLGYRLFMSAKPRSSTEHANDIVLIHNIEMGVRIELW